MTDKMSWTWDLENDLENDLKLRPEKLLEIMT